MKQKPINYRMPKLAKTARQASKSLLNTSTRISHRAFRGLAKHQSETNETANRYINVMEAQQSINFIFANIRLRNRRMHRENLSHERLVVSGKEDDFIRITLGWIIDHALFVIDLVWGVIQPILLILVMLIIRLVLIVVFTAVGFYLLYKIITS